MVPQRRDVLVVISDTHLGSSTGLTPPDIQLDNGDHHTQSIAQSWIWSKWTEFWEDVYTNYKPKNGGKRWLIFCGDMADTPGQHSSTEFWTFNEATVKTVAVKTFKPHVVKHDYAFMIRGTEAHVGAEAQLEEALAEELGCVRNKERGTYSWWDLPLRIQDATFHFAHYITMGQKEWTKANRINSLAVETILDYKTNNEEPPQFVIRSHVHRFADSGMNYSVRAMTTPAWQLKTSYVKRKSPVTLSDIGGIIFCIEGSNVQVVVKKYTTQRHPAWTEPVKEEK